MAQLPMGACRKVVEAAVVRTPALDKTFCGVVRTKETGEVFVWCCVCQYLPEPRLDTTIVLLNKSARAPHQASIR